MGPDRWALNLGEGEGVLGTAWGGIKSAWSAGRKGLVKLGGGYTKDEHSDRVKAISADVHAKGVGAGKRMYGMDNASDTAVAKEFTGRTLKKVGKVGSDIGVGVGDAVKKGMQGVRQGLEDNPAGIAGAAAGALAAGWGLSKLRRKKAPV